MRNLTSLLVLLCWSSGCSPRPPSGAAQPVAYEYALLDSGQALRPGHAPTQLTLWAEPKSGKMAVLCAVFREGQLLAEPPPQWVEASANAPARVDLPPATAQAGNRLFVTLVHPGESELPQLKAWVGQPQPPGPALYDLLSRWHSEKQSLAHGGQEQIEVGAVRPGPASARTSNETLEKDQSAGSIPPAAQRPQPKIDWKSRARSGECSPSMHPVLIYEFR